MNPDKDSEALIVAIRLEHEATGKDYIALKFIRSNGRGEEQLVLPASIALQDKRGTRKQLIDHGAVIADDLEIDALIDPEQPVGSFFDSPGWKANSQAFEFPDDSVGDADFPAFFDKESLLLPLFDEAIWLFEALEASDREGNWKIRRRSNATSCILRRSTDAVVRPYRELRFELGRQQFMRKVHRSTSGVLCLGESCQYAELACNAART